MYLACMAAISVINHSTLLHARTATTPDLSSPSLINAFATFATFATFSILFYIEEMLLSPIHS